MAAASTYQIVPRATGAPATGLDIVVLNAATRRPVCHATVQNSPHPTTRFTADSMGRMVLAQPGTLTASDSLFFDCPFDYMPLRIPTRLAVGQSVAVLLAPRIERAPSGQVSAYIIQKITPKSLALQFPGAPLIMHFSRLPDEEAKRLLSASQE